MTRLAKFTFAEIRSALYQAKVGDYVMVAVSRNDNPTRYRVETVEKDWCMDLVGGRGAKRRLINNGKSEWWLCRNDGEIEHCRRVIQAWSEKDVDGRRRSDVAAAAAEELSEATDAMTLLALDLGLQATSTDPGYIRAEIIAMVHKLQAKAQAASTRLAFSDDGLRVTIGSTTFIADDGSRAILGKLLRSVRGMPVGDGSRPPDVSPAQAGLEVMDALYRSARPSTKTCKYTLAVEAGAGIGELQERRG